jgi:hypothetical protein
VVVVGYGHRPMIVEIWRGFPAYQKDVMENCMWRRQTSVGIAVTGTSGKVEIRKAGLSRSIYQRTRSPRKVRDGESGFEFARA